MINGEPDTVNPIYITTKPQDISINQIYEFYVKVIAIGGGYFVSNKKTLVVGCTNDLDITPHPDFVTLVDGIDPQNPLNIKYEVKQPSLSLDYCSI